MTMETTMKFEDRLTELLTAEEDWLGPAEECVREYRGEIDLPWPLSKMYAVEPTFSDCDWRALFEDEREARQYVLLRNSAPAVAEALRAARALEGLSVLHAEMQGELSEEQGAAVEAAWVNLGQALAALDAIGGTE